AHLLGAEHPAIFAAGSATSGRSAIGEGSSAQLTTASQTQAAVKLQGNTSLRAHRIVTRKVRENKLTSSIGTGLRRKRPISPNPIRAGHQSSSAKRRKEAQRLSNKMQQRLAAKGRDF
ncbi:hypothetical protein LCGC14_2026610, partial [marine sediment metagenome]